MSLLKATKVKSGCERFPGFGEVGVVFTYKDYRFAITFFRDIFVSRQRFSHTKNVLSKFDSI